MIFISDTFRQHRTMSLLGWEDLKIIGDGATFSASRLQLTTRSPFLYSLINSIEVCQCEPTLLLMTDHTPEQIQEALALLSGEFLHSP